MKLVLIFICILQHEKTKLHEVCAGLLRSCQGCSGPPRGIAKEQSCSLAEELSYAQNALHWCMDSGKSQDSTTNYFKARALEGL